MAPKTYVKIEQNLTEAKATLWLASLAIEVDCIESHINIVKHLLKRMKPLEFLTAAISKIISESW